MKCFFIALRAILLAGKLLRVKSLILLRHVVLALADSATKSDVSAFFSHIIKPPLIAKCNLFIIETKSEVCKVFSSIFHTRKEKAPKSDGSPLLF